MVDENGNDYWTGKQLFSIVLPKDLNLKYKAKICHGCKVCKKEQCEYDAYVKIVNGELVCGTISPHPTTVSGPTPADTSCITRRNPWCRPRS